jgi:CubicO group peptidase (beta-lactamase class C family)
MKAAALIVLVLAALAAFLTRAAAVTAPLFAHPQEVPSVVDRAPSPQYAAAVERARELVRAAVLEQNLPGISVAVGAGLPAGALAKEGGTIVWAEGFGWRDVDTLTPITPNTRFNIGTAASAVTAAVAPLGLTNTGADSAAAWSPEHIGEPEEDFPPFTIIRHAILQPLGLAPAEYPLPGDRATCYVPRSDDNPRRGRRLMYMRDLACCEGTMAFYSTASDLVRVGLANNVSINGELAGGMVMSLMSLRDSRIVVAVLSNIAHANTSALGVKIGDAFAKQAR